MRTVCNRPCVYPDGSSLYPVEQDFMLSLLNVTARNLTGQNVVYLLKNLKFLDCGDQKFEHHH